MRDTRPLLLHSDFPPVHRASLETLQVNLGYLCNLSCVHCHVNAGPHRTEQMDRETIDGLLALLDRASIQTLDLTGGAPELNPHFRYLVREARALGVHVIDRCTTTHIHGQASTVAAETECATLAHLHTAFEDLEHINLYFSARDCQGTCTQS